MKTLIKTKANCDETEKNDDAKCTTHLAALFTTRTLVYGLSPAVINVDLSLYRSVQGSRKTRTRSNEQ